MATPSNDVMEMILRECETAAGEPWYPSDYVTSTGVDKDTLDASVDQLRLGGLVELTEWAPGKGQGYILTPEGNDVLGSPRLLNQLRKRGVNTEPAPNPRRAYGPDDAPQWDRSKVVMEALMEPSRPVVSMTIICTNLLVFFWGIFLATQNDVTLGQFAGLSPGKEAVQIKIAKIRYDTGALNIQKDRAEQSWWRLLTSCFVHHGLFHLGMNMLAVYLLGPFVERIWGSLRFVILYLVAGLGGSVVAVILARDQPTFLAGASGAICGLLGSALPWVLINWSSLPRQMASGLFRNVLINGALITFISVYFSEFISWQAHLGGAVAGAALAVPLNFSRFGIGGMRLLGWVGVAILPFVLIAYMVFGFQSTEVERGQWLRQKEVRHGREKFTKAILNARKDAAIGHSNFTAWLNAVLNQEKPTKTHSDVSKIVAKSYKSVKKLNELVTGAKTYKDDRVNQSILAVKQYFEKWDEYFKVAQDILNRKGNIRNVDIRRIDSITHRLADLWSPIKDSVLSPSGLDN